MVFLWFPMAYHPPALTAGSPPHHRPAGPAPQRPTRGLLVAAATGRGGAAGGDGGAAMQTRNHHLIGGLEHFLFSHILGIIIPTD